MNYLTKEKLIEKSQIPGLEEYWSKGEYKRRVIYFFKF